MNLRSPPSLYSLATGVVPSQYFAPTTPKLDEILPTSVLLDVLLKKSALQRYVDIRLVNSELSRLSTFLKLLTIKRDHGNSVRRLCKVVSNGGIGENDLFPGRLASAFQDEMPKVNSKLIDDGMVLGEFLHEVGFKASVTILKLCLDHCEKGVPSAQEPCLADHQRYKILVGLLNAQVRHSMLEEAKSTRFQALKFIEKWEHSEGIHLAELYSALASLATLEGNIWKSFYLSRNALELMNASPNHYTDEYGPTSDIKEQLTLSHIKCNFNMGYSAEIERVLTKGLVFANCMFGPRSPKRADILAIFYQHYLVIKDPQRAARAAKECWEIRVEAFGRNNVLTKLAKKNMDDAISLLYEWLLKNGLLRLPGLE